MLSGMAPPMSTVIGRRAARYSVISAQLLSHDIIFAQSRVLTTALRLHNAWRRNITGRVLRAGIASMAPLTQAMFGGIAFSLNSRHIIV